MTESAGGERSSSESPRSADSPRKGFWLVLALALACQLPSLRLGFYADDYVHQIALHDPGRFGDVLRPWSLYDFGTYADWVSLYERFGGMPWWISPDWKVRFFRPLTSLSLWIDAKLFGHWA